MTKDIIIANKDGNVFNLYFKNILDLDDKEFEKLTAKLSHIDQFKGVFYKQSTDTNPLTFKDMGLIETITKYRETRKPEYSEHESLLSTFVLFSKDSQQAVAYASFFFYPEENSIDKPNHFLEPDLIFFTEIRGQGISRPITACLMADIFQKIIADERLNEYGGLYLTVHPRNLPSKKVFESLGFKYKQIDEELSKQSGSTEAIESIENLGERMIATNKDRPLELFKKIKTVLEENNTKYEKGEKFLEEQIKKLTSESDITDSSSQAIKNQNEKGSQTCIAKAPALTIASDSTRAMATPLTSGGDLGRE
jgi:RimJ/RimL family protein N-acetyltransferase